VISAQYGRVDPELFFNPATRPEREEKVRQLSFEDLYADEYDHDHEGHPHAAYESIAVDFGAADPDNRYAVHAVGRFPRFYPSPWARGEERLTQLVLMGRDRCRGAPKGAGVLRTDRPAGRP
jgi:hypothetical protein